jgi:flagellar biosynthesis protein FlhA
MAEIPNDGSGTHNAGVIALNNLFQKAAQSADLMMALGVVGIVGMLVIPLPTFLLDIFMSFNIAIGLILVLTSIYIEDSVDFAVFPSLLLVTTLMRLALNVSSTRLILLQGKDFDGEVVQAFGNFVVGGDYVVGLIIFIILVLVQYLVITKGSDRVAEVAARFTLDAMPGKQMAIDADLGAGLIDEGEAKSRREKISKEAEFYGAMDGASKFVKGDTIAGIIITAINIVGGIIIGYFSGKFGSIAEIAETYTLLTVGDGLVSIIPSLLISVAAGVIVTRSSSEEDLGTDIMGQLFSEPKALLIASGVFLAFGMIPGLPKIPFFLISIFLAAVGYLLRAEIPVEASADTPGGASPGGAPAPGDGGAAPAGDAGGAEEEDAGPEDVAALLQVDPLELEIGYALIPMVDPKQGGDLLNRVKMIRRQIAMELGLIVPAIRIRDNMQLPPNNYSVKLYGTEIGGGDLNPDMFLAMDPGTVTERVDGISTVEPAFNLPAIWIEEIQREEAELNGYTVVDASSVVATHLTELVKRFASELLGRQEVKSLVEKIKEQYPAVVEAVVPDDSAARLGLVQKILQALLKEGISIRNFPTILEVIADYVEHAKDMDSLVEYVRQGLARQITTEFMVDNVLRVLVIDPSLEQRMADSVQQTNSIHQGFAPNEAQGIFDSVNQQVEEMLIQGWVPVLVCSPIVRPHFKRMVERVSPQLVVLSYNEVVTDVQIENVGVVQVVETGFDGQ